MKHFFLNHLQRNAVAGGGGGEDKRTEEQLLLAIGVKIEDALKTRATVEELAALRAELPTELKGIDMVQLRAMADDKTGAMAILARQGLEIQKLKTNQAAQPEDMSVRAQIKRWHDTVVEKGSELTVRAALENMANGGGKTPLPQLELRVVASPMLPSNTYNGSAYLPKPEFQAGATEIIRKQPTFWNYIRKGSTGAAAYVWVNKKNPQGVAGFIGPGVAKPGISFEIATEISNAKKIAASEKVAMELLQDIEGFASWVEMELIYQVEQKASTTLMSGTGSSTSPAGIQTISVAYTATGIKTANPNDWDAIVACVAQLHSGNLFGEVTAFINPIDYANMVLTKAVSQGQLFIPPATGATIVVDNNIPIGSLQIALLDYYKVLIYKGFTLSYGWENDDFTKNLSTVIGEMRIHQYFSQNHTGAFIFDTFAAIKTAITPAP